MPVFRLLLFVVCVANLVHAWPVNAPCRDTRAKIKTRALPRPLPNTVRRVILSGNRTTLLVGCLHGSNSAVQDVTNTILTHRPRAVVLELCLLRYKRLQYDQRIVDGVVESETSSRLSEWGSIVQATFKSGGPVQGSIAGLLALSQALQPSSFKKGAEFSAAIRSVRALTETSCDLILGDTNADETIRRAACRTPRLDDIGRLVPTMAQALGVSSRQGPALEVLKVVLTPGSRVADDVTQLLVRLFFLMLGLAVPLSMVGFLGNYIAAGNSSPMQAIPTGVMAFRYVFDLLLVVLGSVFISQLVETIIVERNAMLATAVLRTADLVPEGSNIVVVLGLLHVNGVADDLRA